MRNDDLTWIQRFKTFQLTLHQLEQFLKRDCEFSFLEKQGLIHVFESNYELAWNVINDYFQYQGEQGIRGSRDAIRLALNRVLITDGETWFDMVDSRIKSSHTYNMDTAEEIVEKIISHYFDLFQELETTFEGLEEADG